MTITKEQLQKILTDHPNAPEEQAAAINLLSAAPTAPKPQPDDKISQIFKDHPNDDAKQQEELRRYVDGLVTESQRAGEGSSNSLLSLLSGQSKAARDPVEVMQDVFKNQTYTDREKNLLFFMSRQRFENRRKMAYYSLSMLIGGAILIAAAMIYDGIHPLVCADAKLSAADCTQNNLVFRYTEIIKANTEALSWIGGFFTSVIALYYGASSLRPTS